MIYLIVGVPGSGKTWVSNKLEDKFTLVKHDDYIKKDYARALYEADGQNKPVLGELPFSISEVTDKLTKRGCEIKHIFIIEDEKLLADRYKAREGRLIPQGHLTRQTTYKQRAIDLKAFIGTSEQALNHLRKI